MGRSKNIDIAIGVDIGGTKIRTVLWDGKRVAKMREFNTPKTLGDFKKLLSSIFNDFAGEKIGIGFPGIISGSKILFCPNIKYLKNFDVKKEFRNFSVKIDNDAGCFARAVCPKTGLCLALTLGTGIGRGLAQNGKVLKIKKFEYPERWEGDYQKLRDNKNDKKLSDFLTNKLAGLIRQYKPRVIVIGGGVAARKSLKLDFPHKRAKLGQNAATIGAAMLWK